MRKIHALCLAIGAAACGATAPSPVPTTGYWQGPAVFADAGEVPLTSCGSGFPPCRRIDDQRYQPALAVNRHGQAVALWHRHEGAYRLFSSRFVPASGWNDPEPVSRLDGSRHHKVGLDASGNALAVWGWDDRPGMSASASERRGWGPAQPIWEGAGCCHNFSVGEDGHGVVLFPGLQARHFVRGQGWGALENVRRGPLDPCRGVELTPHPVAAAPAGGAFALWSERGVAEYGTASGCTQTFRDVWAARYRPRQGWMAPEPVRGVDDGLSAFDVVAAAVDPDGDAAIVFVRISRFDVQDVWLQRFSTHDGWRDPELVGTAVAMSTPLLATDRDGNIFVTWIGTPAYGENVLWGKWFWKRSATWDMARAFPTTFSAQPFSTVPGGLQVAVDDAGHAMLAWTLDGPSGTRISASRFTANEGWDSGEVVADTPGWSTVSPPQLGMDARGNALVVWAESDGRRMRMAFNRFVIDR